MHKNRLRESISAIATIACGIAFVITDTAIAQESKEETVIVTGTRRVQRSATDTPAPVDIISAGDLAKQGDTDTANVIRNLVPSFNVNTQSINDAASVVRPANLRGLAPDHTLVLVNGKRRHRSAVIAFVGGGIANGSQGVDISTIPSSALKQVEVLRDGAAAQYGSDAIAGVMNFILKTADNGLNLSGKWGTTYEGDGSAYTLDGSMGTKLGENGFLNLAFEYGQQDATSRSVQRADAAALAAAGNTAIPNPAQVWGQPEIKDDYKLWFNAGIDISENLEFYAFGNLAGKDSEGGFYYRNPNTRGGVFSNDGGVTRLVGDTTPGTGTTCPTVTIGSATEAAAIAAIKADPTCFMFLETFPGGFTPKFGGKVKDSAFAFGLKGNQGKLNWDASFNTGRNQVDFHIRNTINASLGPNSPTEFNPGGQVQTEKNFNLDLDYAVPVSGLASDLNIAGGFEWRDEEFELKAGEAASYTQGPLAVQGFSVGSNGFNGFTPLAAGKWNTSSKAVYLDLEADVTKQLVLGAAVRAEDYDSFGSTTNYKLSSLFKVNDALSLRGTYSTGFRAPTPGQANIINTSTVLIGGVLANIGTVPPTSTLGKLIGGKELKPETSKNLSLGAGLKVGKLRATFDFFQIKMEDRITQRGGVAVSQATINALPTADKNNLRDFGVLNASYQLNADLASFTYFTNDFGSTTNGFDLVVSYPLVLGDHSPINLTFLLNNTETQVDYGQGTLGSTITKEIESALPHWRSSITATHDMGKFGLVGRLNYFGEFQEQHADDDTIPIDVDSQITFDAEVSYHLNDHMTFVLGAQNLFDSYPTKNPWDWILGAKYPVTAPAGFNGGFYYGKVSIKY